MQLVARNMGPAAFAVRSLSAVHAAAPGPPGLCKAVTAAVLGYDAKVVVSAFPDEPSGLAAVKAGKIDLLGGATPSLQNQAHYPVAFGPTVVYDGQGFLVPTNGSIKTLNDLAGKLICYMGTTAAEQALAPALSARNIKYIPFPFEEVGEMEAALVSGRCATITGEIFERDVGMGSPLKLAPGQSARWNKGGLLYPAPIR
jgi:general L-amino acid transport system substrate-binding protein